jgi:hypothetical protein
MNRRWRRSSPTYQLEIIKLFRLFEDVPQFVPINRDREAIAIEKHMLPRCPDWSRPLSQKLVIPTVTTLATLADARVLIQHLPEDRREKSTWRHIAAQLEQAAAGIDVV